MIYGILLAAGKSSRMGYPKQLLDWHGRPLVCHIVEQALASHLDGLVVVVGAAAEAVCAALHDVLLVSTPRSPPHPYALPYVVVENQDYAVGQARSLQVGLAALPSQAYAAMVILVDQPLISWAVIDLLITDFRLKQAAIPHLVALVPYYHGRRGNPVILSRTIFPELEMLQGDYGARAVLQRYHERVHRCDIDDPAIVADIDTWREYAQLQRYKDDRK